MRYSIGEKRSTDNFRVKALLQGRSDGVVPTDPNFYIGDRYIKSNNLLVQIHKVYLKNDIVDANGKIIYRTGDEIVMLAAVLPTGYIGGAVARKLTHKEIRARI
ncbi:MAG: hypothetical protein Q4A15_12030 [Prevotellaceae bacterium]|nr:hypothetical protein [Prevotellaceae bacterium]